MRHYPTQEERFERLRTSDPASTPAAELGDSALQRRVRRAQLTLSASESLSPREELQQHLGANRPPQLRRRARLLGHEKDALLLGKGAVNAAQAQLAVLVVALELAARAQLGAQRRRLGRERGGVRQPLPLAALGLGIREEAAALARAHEQPFAGERERDDGRRGPRVGGGEAPRATADHGRRQRKECAVRQHGSSANLARA